MRDEQDARSARVVHFPHQLENAFGILAIEIAGWLIGKQNIGVHGQAARNRDALLLAARHIV